MLIELPKDKQTQERIEQYLQGRGIYYEVGKPAESEEASVSADPAEREKSKKAISNKAKDELKEEGELI